MCVTAVILLFGSCKKNPAALSGESRILDMVLKKSVNTQLLSDLSGTISADTITFIVPPGTNLKKLVPDISYVGAGISPASHTAIDFTHPQPFRVTSPDGQFRVYTVIVRTIFKEKIITSFSLLASANPTVLKTDVIGLIGNDTIELQVPAGIPLQSLVPTINHTGVWLRPGTEQVQDFSKPLQYRVQAEDSSYELYTVIAGANVLMYVGGTDGFVYALNALTGKLKWKFKTDGAVYSSPAVQDETVFIGSTDGYAYAINAVSGTLVWKTFLQDSILSTPTILNGVVYMTTDRAWALQATTGKPIWSSASYGRGLSSPTVSQSRFYFGQPSHGVWCLNTATGAVTWHIDAGIVYSNPAIADGIIYFGTAVDNIMAANALTGEYKWRSGFSGSGSPSNPTISDQSVYVGTVPPQLHSYSLVTTRQNWNVYFLSNVTGVQSGLFYSPLVANGTVYTANSDGYIYAIDAVSTKLKWRFGSARQWNGNDLKSIANITLANGIIFCGSHDGNIYALDASTGTVLWRHATSGSVYSGPCVVDTKGIVFHPGVSGDQQ